MKYLTTIPKTSRRATAVIAATSAAGSIYLGVEPVRPGVGTVSG